MSSFGKDLIQSPSEAVAHAKFAKVDADGQRIAGESNAVAEHEIIQVDEPSDRKSRRRRC